MAYGQLAACGVADGKYGWHLKNAWQRKRVLAAASKRRKRENEIK